MLPKPEPAAGQVWHYHNRFGTEDTVLLLYTQNKTLRVLWLRGHAMSMDFYSIDGQLASQLVLNSDEYTYLGTLNGELLVEKLKIAGGN